MMKRSAVGSVGAGSVVTPRDLVTVSGVRVPIPDTDKLIHLQFRRFAGCPICNTHLQSIVRRHDEIAEAGIREVVVFHSTDQELIRYVAHLPFPVVGDPDKGLYTEFGVGSSPRAVLDPRVAPVLGRVLRQLPGIGDSPPANLRPTGGRLGLPAEFLIDPHGLVIACKRGSHAYDQWSVDELFAHAR